MNIEDYREYCLSLGPDIEEKLPFKRFKNGEGVLVFTVKKCWYWQKSLHPRLSERINFMKYFIENVCLFKIIFNYITFLNIKI